ncbi:rhamnosyltransferase [Pseudobutyrivibrio sp. UC1225]|uniref:glycosyltransferase family 2 protein n=1 Tax=Pseudobutyrivibrio sp. UC1225 TaxID=1798185 RepID=UPI0008E39385|nr:glycosyltransferase family 2 protein [Pseudobutyrivibrio sp. UC1225]SFN78782.1 rhamnosyltransferase [Pseudobutyrivibrio sp. UC1225]
MKSSELKNVTILMSTYNGEKYLEQQLSSIVAQKSVNLDVKIRDDGSTDSTIDIITKWSDKLRITYYVGENIGSASSFLELLYNVTPSKCGYYAFSDQDDYWLADKLSTAVDILEKYDDIPALYYSNAKIVGKNLEEIDNPFKKSYHTDEFGSALVLPQAAGCTMVFNTRLLEIIQKYKPSNCYMHDIWVLNVCLAVGGRVIYDSVPHILYRQHESNVVSVLGKDKMSHVELFSYRVRKFFDYRYKPSIVASQLKKGYCDYIPSENMEIINLLLDGDKSLLHKLQLITNRKIKTPYMVYNIRFIVQILLNEQ